MLVAQVFGKAEQDADGELVVKEAAFDVAGGRHTGARVEADDVAALDAERAGLLSGRDRLVQQNLGGVKGAARLAVLAVAGDGGVAELERALDDLAGARKDADVFRFAVFCAHTAEIHKTQTAVCLDLCDHAAEGVGMGLKQQAAFLAVCAAEIDEDAALGGDRSGEAERGEGVIDPLRRVFGKTGGAVDREKRNSLLDGVLCIFLFHEKTPLHVFYLVLRIAQEVRDCKQSRFLKNGDIAF